MGCHKRCTASTLPMYAELLPALRCPACNGSLHIQGNSQTDRWGEIVRALLHCSGCGASFAVRAGILEAMSGAPPPRTPAQLVNRSPIAAWTYERLWRHRALTLLSGEPFGYERELPLIAALVDPQPGRLYLDLACSNGLYARALARRLREATSTDRRDAGHVVGVDHSLPMLRVARAFARREGLRVSFVQASVQRLPFAAGCAAAATMGGSLNEIGDLDAALSETSRVLPQGGRFVSMHLVQATTRAGQGLQRLMATGGIAFFTPQALAARFRAHALRPTAHWRYGVVTINQYQKQ